MPTNVPLTEEMVLARTRVSSLGEVKKLNYWASNLDDISVLKKTANIEILTLSVNNIATLRDLENCKNLTELYIRNNNVSDINDVWFLRKMKKLRILWLADNPCAIENKDYRLIVLKVLPKLNKLDSAIVTPEELEAAREFEYAFPQDEDAREEEDADISTITSNYEAVLTDLINDFDRLDETGVSESDQVASIEVKEEIKVSFSTDTEQENDTDKKPEANEYEDDFNDSLVLADTAVTTNGDNHDGVATENAKKEVPITRMSVEETNKLRLELGLKPLPVVQETQNAQAIQSPNVLAAVLSLVKDLNVDGLEMVIGACQYRKEFLKSIFYEA